MSIEELCLPILNQSVGQIVKKNSMRLADQTKLNLSKIKSYCTLHTHGMGYLI